MSFENCINTNEFLSKKQKEDLLKKYDEAKSRYGKSMGDTQAAAMAANELVGTEMARLTQKKLNTINDILNWQETGARLDARTAAWASDKAQAGKVGGVLFDTPEALAAREHLERINTKQVSLANSYKTMIGDVIEKFRSKAAGLKQDVEGFKPIMRALLGDSSVTGDARSMGDGIRAVFSALEARYKAAGGIMGKVENYFPQAHNAYLVKKMGYAAWKDLLMDTIDINKMTDIDTGLPMNWNKLATILPKLYDGIISNGLNELEEAAAKGVTRANRGASGLAQRRAYSRFFHFKDADAFMAYNRVAGYGDDALFGMMLNHIDRMARDISILENMGPKPENTIARMLMRVEAGGAGAQKAKTIQGMYDTLVGRNSFNGELPMWYRALEGTQHWLRSTLLGSAPVSALGDSFFTAFSARMNGIPATKALGQWFKLLNPASETDRMIARQHIAIASAASGASLKAAKFADDTGKSGILPWLAGFTNRASGLAHMTDGARQALPMSTAAFLHNAKLDGTAWADLPDAMKEAFKRWDMGEDDYAKMMSVDATEFENGAKFMLPEDLARAGHLDTAEKYENWLTDMSLAASNEPRLLTRAITTGAIMGQAQKGTLLRGTASTLAMFKSYGLTVILNHLLPSLRHAATARGTDRLSRIAPLLIGTTVMGAAAVQARQILTGKEPKDMDDYKFWQAALLQGGGGGIFGDFLFSDQSRFNSGFATTVAGPVVGLASDIARALKGNFDKALDDGQESKFLSDIYQLARRNIPAVKLWYTRLLMERLLLDQGERMIDPLFDERMNRIESKMQRDTGQQFWWRPGDTTPR